MTFALSPSSAMDCTEPTGTSANCTCAPLERSPTSVKTAVAVRWLPPPDTEQPARATTSDGQRRAPRPVAGAALRAERIRTIPPRRGPSPQEATVRVRTGRPGPEATAATRTRRGRSASGRRCAWTSPATASVAVGRLESGVAWLDSKPPSPELEGPEPPDELEPEPRARAPRAAEDRPEEAAAWSSWSSSATAPSWSWSSWWRRRASSVTGTGRRALRRRRLGALLGVGDLRQTLLQEGLGGGGAAPPVQGVEDGRDVVEQRVEESRRRDSRTGSRVAITAAERPLEWLATMRRQMPASRSRRRPAM